MGSYGISTKEIIEALEHALDNLEGDFSDEQLKEALEITKSYPYVSDKIKSERMWKTQNSEAKHD
jgi:hypothetical protein